MGVIAGAAGRKSRHTRLFCYLALGMLAAGAGPAGAAGGEAGLTAPGTTDYPDGGLRRLASLPGRPAQTGMRALEFDPVRGYAYTITDMGPQSRLLKIAIRSGQPRVVAELPVEPGYVHGLAIDPASGFGYYGSSSVPVLVKFSLGSGDAAPTEAGRVALSKASAAVALDRANGYVYALGTSDTDSSLVKVALAPGAGAPRVVAETNLVATTGWASCLALDTVNGYAYVGTVDNALTGAASRLGKVGLGTGDEAPVEVGAIAVAGCGSTTLGVAGIATDPTLGVGYLDPSGTCLIRFDLGAGETLPTVTASLKMGYSPTLCLVQPGSHRVLYASGGELREVDWNPALPQPAVVRSTPASGINSIWGAFVDPQDQRIYALHAPYDRPYESIDPASLWPGGIVRFAEGGSGELRTEGSWTFDYGIAERNTAGAFMDPVRHTGYLFTESGNVAKMALATDGTTPTLVAATRIDNAKIDPRDSMKLTPESVAIDPVHNYAYAIGEKYRDGRYHIAKIALGEAAEAPRLACSTQIAQVVWSMRWAGIDPATGYGLVIGEGRLPTDPPTKYSGMALKIAVGDGDSSPTVVGAISGLETPMGGVAYDPVHGYAYYAGWTTSESEMPFTKVAVGAGNALPSPVGSVILPKARSEAATFIDPARGCLWVCLLTEDGINEFVVAKVALNGDAPPTVESILRKELEFNGWGGAVVRAAPDLEDRYAAVTLSRHFTSSWFFRLGLGMGAEPPTIDGAFGYSAPNLGIRTGGLFLDQASEIAYFATSDFQTPTELVSVSLARQRGLLLGTKLQLTEPAPTVKTMKLYSHTAAGKLRLALYDNAEPKRLVWQSGEVDNTGANGFVEVPISAGTPTRLSLGAGTYWAVWQTDSSASIGSYTAGAAGSGFVAIQAFGEAPAALERTRVTQTSERWTGSFTYETVSGLEGYMIY